ARIDEMSEDEEFSSEPMQARDFYEKLWQLLEKYGPQVNGTDVYKRLYRIIVLMRWQALPSLDKKIRDQIFGSDLIFALKTGVDIMGNLDAYLYLYKYGVGPDKEERQKFIYSLTR